MSMMKKQTLPGVVLAMCVLTACAADKEGARPESTGTAKRLALPGPSRTGDMSLERALANRRSVRDFRDEKLSPKMIGQLLWAGQGISDPRGFRTAPSAGAIYPLELYLVSPEGVYHYMPEKHVLVKVKGSDRRRKLADAALGQRWVEEAAIDIVIAAVYERTETRYGGRAYRDVHMEAGHAAENILLQAVSLGLGAVPVGAFDGERVADVLSLPEQHRPLYIIPAGVPSAEE